MQSMKRRCATTALTDRDDFSYPSWSLRSSSFPTLFFPSPRFFHVILHICFSVLSFSLLFKFFRILVCLFFLHSFIHPRSPSSTLSSSVRITHDAYTLMQIREASTLLSWQRCWKCVPNERFCLLCWMQKEPHWQKSIGEVLTSCRISCPKIAIFKYVQV